MTAVAINRQQQIEQVVNHVLSTIQSRYPFVSAEIVYDPPDEGDAWIILEGVDDPDQLDEIDDCGRDIRLEAMEKQGILVLVL